MRTVVLAAGAVALGLWSLIAYVLHALAGVVGTTAALNADILPISPDLVVFLSEIFSGAGEIGGILVVVIWVVGTVLIAAATAIGLALTGRGSKGSRLEAQRGVDQPWPR